MDKTPRLPASGSNIKSLEDSNTPPSNPEKKTVQQAVGQPTVRTTPKAPGPDPGIMDLPAELQKSIYNQAINSKDTSMPELARRLANLQATSHAARSSLAEHAKETGQGVLTNEIARQRREFSAQRTAYAIEAALLQGKGSIEGFVVPRALKAVELARVRLMEVEPAMLEPVIKSLGAEPLMKEVELDFGTAGMAARTKMGTAEKLSDAQAARETAVNDRITSTCRLIADPAFKASADGHSRLGLNLDQAVLNPAQIDALTMALETCPSIGTLRLRDSLTPPASKMALSFAIRASQLTVVDLANSNCLETASDDFAYQIGCLLYERDMESLDISANNIGAALAGADTDLLAGVRVNLLKLDNTGLDDRHVEHLARSFGQGSQINTLSLQQNAFSASGEAALRAAAAKANRPISLLF